ncbi:DUF2628 domain-containing protein [Pseudohoeflea suaedae]|uniref:DUF2628 domain-containing protein n=1 Tax=Pseudohoeflea suaedae TaxID=877384 RepID=A0A4R5PMV0_9HYPH|nr:DUF2628 domain-containing protein [Pseudohoeflea suaedae]TDH37827.1 DUF2628 domain-containing protein [Pseudohoeflea suaedae]
MASYAILSDRNAPGGDETARVIADRFAWPAFAFGGFWLLWHRAWFAGALVLIADLTIPLLLYPGGYAGLALALDIALALIVGLEGNAWRLDAEERRGRRIVDIVEAPDPDTAFEIYAYRAAARALPKTPPPLPGRNNQLVRPRPASTPDMIGLVPSRREG